MTSRESYAYPPPLALHQAEPEPATATGPRSISDRQQVARPSLESRMAAERTGLFREAQTLRPRKRVSIETERTAVKAAAGRGPSIAARLERLPPLKRAVIWAEILGPPGGRE